MNGFYIKVLEVLESAGVGVQVDIAPVLNSMFPRPDNSMEQITRKSKLVFSLLNKLYGDGLIEFDSADKLGVSDRINKHKEWFGDFQFNAKLTRDGLLFLYQINSNLSSIRTNKATKRNYKLSSGVLIATFIVGVVGVIGQIFTAYRDTKVDQLENKLIKIEQELSQKNAEILKLKSTESKRKKL